MWITMSYRFGASAPTSWETSLNSIASFASTRSPCPRNLSLGHAKSKLLWLLPSLQTMPRLPMTHQPLTTKTKKETTTDSDSVNEQDEAVLELEEESPPEADEEQEHVPITVEDQAKQEPAEDKEVETRTIVPDEAWEEVSN